MSITILDGGMGQELVARAGRATSLWSTQALLDSPETVRAVHDDFFAAGAEIATTNSYAILPDRLEPHGIIDRLEELMTRACTIACEARDAHGSGLVLGALGPQGFSYQPDKTPPSEMAAEVYANMVKLQAPLVDAHVFETMSSVDQLRGALMGAAVSNKPVWVALSVDDTDGTKLRSGEPLEEVLPLLAEYDPAAVLLNCSLPEVISDAVPLLAGCGKPVGAYANGFTGIHDEFSKVGVTVDLLSSRTDLTPKTYADFAEGWVSSGATIIGGCCEISPAHIRELSLRLKG
ncbi:MAG: homocysteine S-methyltransferase family protein [Litoreibacter sp.]|uniref:homocysteine S-methyltransferase family protein n=1 Tax=Litoreibacter sp. TaxID=1969459 RepID=UPI0032990BD1